jgi:methyl-accepting chemotaxis protein
MCEQISAAAIEQEMVSDEISANISKINSMTIETAAGAEQISNISQELGTMTNQLDKIVSAYTV